MARVGFLALFSFLFSLSGLQASTTLILAKSENLFAPRRAVSHSELHRRGDKIQVDLHFEGLPVPSTWNLTRVRTDTTGRVLYHETRDGHLVQIAERRGSKVEFSPFPSLRFDYRQGRLFLAYEADAIRDPKKIAALRSQGPGEMFAD